jgi:hypothetical protein
VSEAWKEFRQFHGIVFQRGQNVVTSIVRKEPSGE